MFSELLESQDLFTIVIGFTSIRDLRVVSMMCSRAYAIISPLLKELSCVGNDESMNVVADVSLCGRMIASLHAIREFRAAFDGRHRDIEPHLLWPTAHGRLSMNAYFRPARLRSEITRFKALDSPFIAPVRIEDDGYMTILFAVVGVHEPFSGEILFFRVRFSDDHPFSAPWVRLETKIDGIEDGDLRIDLLQEKWSPALSFPLLTITILSVLNRQDLSCFQLPKRIIGEPVKETNYQKWL